MNRNEWVTLAFTLVGAGGTYFVTQKPLWSLAALGVGLLIMLCLFLFDRPKEAALPRQNEVSDSFKQTMENVGNPTVIVYPPTQSPPVPTTHIAPAKHVPPVVECVRTRVIRVAPSGRDGNALSESTIIDSHDPKAVVAYFRNIPAEGTDDHPDIYGVQAQIVYKDTSDNEIQDVPKGIWLDSSGIQTHLLLNQTEGLILMLLVDDKELRAPYQGHYKTFAIGQIATIEVCLTSHNSGRNRVLLRKTFRWIDEDGQIDAIMLPP